MLVGDNVKKILFKYVKSEFKRIQQATKEIELAGNDLSQLRTYYHLTQNKDTKQWEAKNGNALQFQTFPSLNFGMFDSAKMGFELYNADGSIIDYEFLNLDNINDLEEIPIDSIEIKLINYII
jgi:hypothetical protein